VLDKSDTTAQPHVGLAVAVAVQRAEAPRGLLICGTGLGMAISANNCQILTMGERVIGPELAASLVAAWRSHEFDERSASAAKVAVISGYVAVGRWGGASVVLRPTASE
jgi:ribose 5-phosphate isomerase B